MPQLRCDRLTTDDVLILEKPFSLQKLNAALAALMSMEAVPYGSTLARAVSVGTAHSGHVRHNRVTRSEPRRLAGASFDPLQLPVELPSARIAALVSQKSSNRMV
jgi:hypothetical protein